MSVDECWVEQADIGQGNGVAPEMVMRRSTKFRQPLDDFGGSMRWSGPDRSCRDANESVLGYWTCRPAVRLLILEPVVRDLMVDVTRIKQRDENADVKQRNHG
jgi:hypothetical protein